MAEADATPPQEEREEDGEDAEEGSDVVPNGQDVAVKEQAAAVPQMRDDDLRSQVSANHVALMNSAIDRLCERTAKLSHVPRAGETSAVDAYLKIARKAVADGADDAAIQKKLVDAGVQEEQAKAATAALRVRKDEIRTHMVKAASQLSGKYLSDFDWKANVTLASSTASSLQLPSLQLALYLGDSAGGLEELVMELDKERLDALIEAVASARSAIARIPH